MKRRSPEYLKKLERDEILIKFFYCTLARAFILWVELLVVNHEVILNCSCSQERGSIFSC